MDLFISQDTQPAWLPRLTGRKHWWTLWTCLSVRCPSLGLSVWPLPVSLAVRLSVCLPVCPSGHLCPSVCLCLYVCTSVCPSAGVSAPRVHQLPGVLRRRPVPGRGSLPGGVCELRRLPGLRLLLARGRAGHHRHSDDGRRPGGLSDQHRGWYGWVTGGGTGAG